MRKDNFGEIIKYIRVSRGKSQKNIVDALSYNCNLSAIERGKMQLSAVVLFDILDVLNVSSEEFLLISNDYNKNSSDFFLEDMFKNSSILSKENIQSKINKLGNSIKSNSTLSDKHLVSYHQICCFYYLNFEPNPKKAKYHFSYLWGHLYSTGNNLLLSDLDLIPLLIPFIPIHQAQILINDMLIILTKYNIINHKDLLLRTYLNFSKVLILYSELTRLSSICSKIEALLLPNVSIAFFSEFYIIKGIMIYLAQSDQAYGITYIEKGLGLATEYSLNDLAQSWIFFCKSKGLL